MDRIIATNSAIIIENYEWNECEQLEKYFRIYEPVTHSYYYLGIFYDSENKRLYLPRGIDIWFVEKITGMNVDVLINSYTKYQTFDDISIRYLPRDDAQKETLRFMLGKQEYRETATKSQLSVNLSTGKGKTYVTIATLAYLGIRGIVIADSVSWLKQWRDRTVEYTDISEKEICMMSGSGNVFKLLNMSEEYLKKYKLFLVTHDTIQSFGTNYGWDKVTELFEHLKIGIKIFDEAHLNFKNLCMIDFYTNVYKTYYLTATPAKSSDDENRVYQIYFKNIPAIELFDENEDPHTSYVAIQYNSRPSPVDISTCRNKYGLDRNKYTEYVVGQDNFYKLLVIIMDIALKYTNTPGSKFLMYIGTNNAILKVYQWIIENYPELRGDVGIYTSIVSPEEKQEACSKRLILSTTKSAGAAVDIPGLKLTVVLAEPFKSEVIAKQTLGRTRDANTMYIEIVDKGFNQCSRYYYAKLSIFEKYATDCSVIRLSDNELDTRSANIIQNRMAFIATMQHMRVFSYAENQRAFSFSKQDTFKAFSFY